MESLTGREVFIMKRLAIGLALVLAFPALKANSAEPHHVTLAIMNANTRTMFESYMESSGKLWAPDVKLLRSARAVPGQKFPGNYLEDWHYWSKCCFDVRQSGEYALALLLRDGPGDRARAAATLNAVLKNQYLTPGVRWYGTFKRTPEEPDPQSNAVMWRDYDPNWREFIGTTLMVILIEFPDRLPSDLIQRMYAAIDRAVEGEMQEKRLVPAYTNPSMMYGSLWDFAAAHSNHAEWQMKSGNWMETFYSLYRRYGAFSEFNSPTYDAVDLYGLALWREYGSTERIRTMGAEMEAAMWEDIANFYQPDLHNMCGPYDRSYGMDMESYLSGVGPLMATAMEMKFAPVPKIKTPQGSGTQYGVSPQMAMLGTHIPADALAKLKTFQGPHLIRRRITDQRIATAWVGKHAMWGAESTSLTRDVHAASGMGLQYQSPSQFHPVTIQWRTPSGEIGWIRVVEAPMIDAVADEKGITITAKGTLRFRIHARNMAPGRISQGQWDLPGLHVSVTSDPQSVFTLQKTDPAAVDPVQNGERDGFDILYPGITKMRLDIKADADQ